MKNPFYRDLIIESWSDNLKKFDFVHNHLGFECDSCSIIPESINCVWFRNRKKNRLYQRSLCTNCTNKILNSDIPDYFSNYLDLLGVQALSSFPKINFSEVLFISKNYIMKVTNEIEQVI